MLNSHALLVLLVGILSTVGCRPTTPEPVAAGENDARATLTAGTSATTETISRTPEVEPNSTEVASNPTSDESQSDSGIATIQWPAKIQADDLRASINSGIDYLVRTTNNEGKFAYIVHVDPEIPPTSEYNVVRHAGTMYGLGMYLERYKKDAEQVRDALIRQSKFLRRQIEPVTGQKGMLAIWSDPSVTGHKGPKRAELGSAALGLIALSCVERESPGSVPHRELAALAEFILFMQNEDGSFAARYVPDADGKHQVPLLLFYPGEAALALVLLYEVDGNPRWLNAAAKAIAHMTTRRDNFGRPVLDHWLLLAGARIWPHYDKTSAPESREQLVAYSQDLCERLMKPSRKIQSDPRWKGCITGNGMTCPTATRAEGLVAALAYLPQNKAVLRSRVRTKAEDALVFLMESQVNDGQYRGGIPYAILNLPKEHPWRRGSYDATASEIRIDFVHHAISAMMLYDDVVLND